MSKPIVLSRSKIDLFLECPRCFYLDKKLGIRRPGMPGFALNSAVDTLLKKEFDLLRKKKEKHQLMIKYQIDAIPYDHPDLFIWRDDINKKKGITFIHKPTNLEITGIVDDVWVNSKDELIIVDYKSTSTSVKIDLNDKYKQGYKRQIEIYQWIFAQKGFKVSKTSYFVYANASKNRDKFDARLEFDLEIIPYIGNYDWVEPVIYQIREVLDKDEVPPLNKECQYCNFLDKQINILNKI